MYAQQVDTVVVGGGQAGLAVSWALTQRRREHVVLERGQVADRWLTASWDSLRLLTPNWMSRLPGWSYRGEDQEGYSSAAQLVGYLREYSGSFGAPVLTETNVLSVRHRDGHFEVTTDRGRWVARHVVVATGACGSPHIPALATGLASGITQVTPAAYRNPAGLPGGGVLVVGGSASGVQITQELANAGRRVVLSVGQHTRAPRTYRGMDIWWWLDQLGRLDRSIDDVTDIDRARAETSLQLVGRAGMDIDLGILARDGVDIAGRLVSAGGQSVEFAGDLPRSTAVADVRLRRLLDSIDSHVTAHGLSSEVLEPAPYRPVRLPPGLQRLDLAAEGIRTVVWATGYQPSYPWLRVPVLDAAGQIRQRRGLTAVPGLYAVGLRFGQRRSSTLLDGARHDAAAVVTHLVDCRSGAEFGSTTVLARLP